MTPYRSDWQYCRIVHRGYTVWSDGKMWLGQFEIGNHFEKNDIVREALTSSMVANKVAILEDHYSVHVSARMIIPNALAEDVRDSGDYHLDETIRLYNSHIGYGLSRLYATPAGYIIDLRSDSVQAFLPQVQGGEMRSTVAIRNDFATHPGHVLNTLLAAPNAYGELGVAFRRSSHWRAMADSSNDQGQKLLLYWMSAECLSRCSEHDDVTSRFLAAVGFPGKGFSSLVSHSEARRIKSVARYVVWRKRLENLFQSARAARNQIVHSGYRHVDLGGVMTKEQETIASKVMRVVCVRLAEMALNSMNQHVSTVLGMWNEYGRMIDGNVEGIIEWCIARMEEV